MTATAYPLAWPEGWPRTAVGDREEGRFRFKRPSDRGYRQPWTFGAARDALFDEVQKLGGRNPILSTNFETNRYGIASEGRRRPADESVAIYFSVDGEPRVMACDRFTTAEPNMRSIALAIDALRQLERHGGGVMMKRAFAGFTALPAPGTVPWWSTLQVPQTASRAEIEAAFRRLARERHPDQGGSDAMMADLNAARAAALKARD